MLPDKNTYQIQRWTTTLGVIMTFKNVLYVLLLKCNLFLFLS